MTIEVVSSYRFGSQEARTERVETNICAMPFFGTIRDVDLEDEEHNLSQTGCSVQRKRFSLEEA